MKKITAAVLLILLTWRCKDDSEKISPVTSPITESVYASGLIKSRNQYQAYPTASGIIENIFVSEGDTVKVGTPILSIFSETQQLNRENAELAASFNDLSANQGKLNDAVQLTDIARNKLKIDSSLYYRQKNLWQQQIGTKIDLEQKELAFQNSKSNYLSSLTKLEDLKRQLAFISAQSRKNLAISSRQEKDFTVRSEIDGVVYDLLKSRGEIVSPQTPLAILGDDKKFVLEMQVDEYDIFRIKKGQKVLATLDSYKGKVFEASVSKIYPIMNERSKSFLVESEFTDPPQVLYPNITFEANIILRTKDRALLIPRSCMINDSTVRRADGSEVKVRTGLKDLQNIEIVSGLNATDELLIPQK